MTNSTDDGISKPLNRCRTQFVCIESNKNSSHRIKQQCFGEAVQSSQEQPYKGIYTWLSSPKVMYSNRNATNIAVVPPTQHHM